VSVDRVDLAVPAKINLRLRVLAREEDGYHQLETLFCAIDLADRVTLERAPDGITLDTSGDVGGASQQDNLVTRAARAWFRRTGLDAGVRIRLEKRIPTGAGLGGGSSDAAATLLGLNRLFGLGLPIQDLVDLGGGIGADVPFFLGATPFAWAGGRGDRVLPLSPLPSRSMVLALPALRVDTGWAFRTLAERRGRGRTESMAFPGRCLDTWAGVSGLVGNDFEPILHEAHPELRRLLDAMLETGPVMAHMTGSGSAHFAIYEHRNGARAALERLTADLPDVRFVMSATLNTWPERSGE
jgi:4-diphosphocytidyl-2-C-methyl-D-erythritol kinase